MNRRILVTRLCYLLSCGRDDVVPYFARANPWNVTRPKTGIFSRWGTTINDSCNGSYLTFDPSVRNAKLIIHCRDSGVESFVDLIFLFRASS